MIIKVWPNGFIASEDKSYGGPELNYGCSDDYFVIDLEVLDQEEIVKLVSKHFTGDQLQLVLQDIMIEIGG